MNLALALRLTLRGDRAGRVRLLLITTGVALGVVLLLAVTGAIPASNARQAVLASRSQTYGSDSQAPPRHGVAAQTSTGYWRGREVHSLRFRLVGRPVTPPAGAARLPRPGEVLISPALEAALRGPHGTELAARLPGRPAGSISPAGLLGPRELYFLAPAAHELDRATLSSGFQPLAAVPHGPVSDDLRVGALLAGVALIVPLLVLIGTSTRLSAASRERRTAAMRLVGATGRQVTVLAAVEGGVLGLLGALAGGLAFLLLRVPAAGLLPMPDGVYGTTVTPAPLPALAVLLGVPLLAAATGVLALRRVVSSPLAVTRQAQVPKAGLLRLVPLATGLGMLLLAYADRRALLHGGRLPTVLLVGGAGLVLLGLTIAGAALARAAGLALHAWGPGTASQLAGRRLVLDPAAAARTVTGTTLVVAVLGWVLAFLPLLAQAQSGYLEKGARLVRPGTVVAAVSPGLQHLDLPALRARTGVRAVVQIDTVQLLRPGAAVPDPTGSGPTDPAAQPLQVLVANCQELAAVLVSPLPGCHPGEVQLLAQDDGSTTIQGDGSGAGAPSGRLRLLTGDSRLVPGRTIQVPPHPSVVTVPGALTGALPGLQLSGALIIPTAVAGKIPSSSIPNLLTATDGRPDTIEAVRTLLAPVTFGYPPLTPAEAVQQARAGSDGYRQATLLGVLAVVLVGGLTLAVSTADGLHERRRAHAALIALGTPLRVLQRSVLLQVAAPLLFSVLLAVAVASICSAIYLRLGAIGEQALPLPWTGYGIIAAAALAASLIATATTLPLIRAAGRPEALRAE